MSSNPGTQNTILAFFKKFYLLYICVLEFAIFDRFLKKYGTNIPFCSSLDKFVGKKNPKTYTPISGEVSRKWFGFWGAKEYFERKFPLISFPVLEQIFRELVSPFCNFQPFSVPFIYKDNKCVPAGVTVCFLCWFDICFVKFHVLIQNVHELRLFAQIRDWKFASLTSARCVRSRLCWRAVNYVN